MQEEDIEDQDTGGTKRAGGRPASSTAKATSQHKASGKSKMKRLVGKFVPKNTMGKKKPADSDMCVDDGDDKDDDVLDADFEYESDSDTEDEYDDVEFNADDMLQKAESWAEMSLSLGKLDSVTRVKEVHPYSKEYQFGKVADRSKGQTVVADKIRKELNKSLAKPLVAGNNVYIPRSTCERKGMVNLTHLQIKDLGRKRGVYFVDETGKIGRSVDLGGRYDNVVGIIMIFDYDYASSEAIEIMTKAIEKIANMQGVRLEEDIKNLDHKKIVEMEKEGLSIFPRLLFHLMTNDKASEVQGILNAMNLNNIETALATSFNDDYDIDIQQESALDEHLICGLGKWVNLAEEETVDVARQFFTCLKKNLKEDVYEYIMKNPQDIKSILSWARCLTSSEKKAALKGLEKLDACKVLIMKVILGVSGQLDSDEYYKDTIIKGPGEGKDMYNKEKYSTEDLEEGYRVLIQLIEELEKHGGIRAVDINELVLKHQNNKLNLIRWLEGRNWKPFFSYCDLVVLQYTGETADGKPRIIFANRPACWTLFSGQYRKSDGSPREMGVSDSKSQARRAKTGSVMQKIFQVLKMENASPDDIKPSSSIRGNLIFAFAFRMYLLENLHVFTKVATLLAKYLLVDHINPLDEDYHGLGASKLGPNKKAQKRARRDARYNKDYQVTSRILNRTTRLRSDEPEETEIDHIASDIVTELTFYSAGSKQKSEKRSDQKRLESWKSFKDKFVLDDNGLLGLIARVDTLLANMRVDEDKETNKSVMGKVTGMIGKKKNMATDAKAAAKAAFKAKMKMKGNNEE